MANWIVVDGKGVDWKVERGLRLSLGGTTVAKALAVVHGLRFALEMGFLSAILESDSRSVIQKLTQV
ncbi:hypothetical protein J1N35_007773 [Gossypium stocksii]|uniref:RNase H type-1 domain-containing protein n=1 Tax=Gossypium stocksii TaxID=47602 RepID=A0A9D3W933_9ROSI|nr:hypothetical protein J1N35_007773 [Gossypium stocksii]